MPKGKTMHIGKADMKTPASVMGNQGSSVKIAPSFNKSKPTKHTKFPG